MKSHGGYTTSFLSNSDKTLKKNANFIAKLNKTLSYIWLGTSVENKEVTDRIEHLRQVAASVRFASFEPLTGSVGQINLNNIHWAIVGGKTVILPDPYRKNGLMKSMISAVFITLPFSSNNGEKTIKKS